MTETASQIRDRIIGQLRARRISRGLSQERLASEIGTHQPNLGKWEKFEQAPTLGNLIRWAIALGYTIEIRDGLETSAGVAP